uniref:Speckle-type POZ protein-like protein n=1 Tax=Aegilops tauschii TaxID=37682 RepID=M8BE88_AEGTA
MASTFADLNQVVRSVRLLRIQEFSSTRDGESGFEAKWDVDGRATLACRLVDPSGELEPAQEGSVSATFYHPQEFQLLCPVDLIDRDFIPSGYLKNDTLTLCCSITVYKEESPAVPTIPAEEAIAPPSSNLHQHLGELLQSETGADETFLVGDESFAAHKNILAARSPVFNAQFFGDMKERCSARVEIEDMEVAAFRAMLHFIYSDTVPELDHPLQEATTMAQHLLAASDRYQLDKLKLICEIKLSGGITVDTAATTLALAEQHNCLKLKAKCIKFIVSTPVVLGDVLATEGYKHLEASCPLVLTELLKSVHVTRSSIAYQPHYPMSSVWNLYDFGNLPVFDLRSASSLFLIP